MEYLNINLGLSTAQIGGHTARSMMFNEMRILILSLPTIITKLDIIKAILEENVLEKPTLSSRKNSLRHLVELYGLDPSKAMFRVLWELGHEDIDSLAQLCLIGAYARDPQLQHSFKLICTLRVGDILQRETMELFLENGFPDRFSPAMKKSMAQNVNTTWTYGGHLEGKAKKIRKLPEPRPVSAAYAMFVGYLTGLRGEQLLNSAFTSLVSSNKPQMMAALSIASAKGLISLKQAAGIVEIDFTHFLKSSEEALLHESN